MDNKKQRDLQTLPLHDRRMVNSVIWFCCFITVFGSTIVVYVTSWSQNSINNNGISTTTATTITLLSTSKLATLSLLFIGWINIVIGTVVLLYSTYVSNPPKTNPIAFRNFRNQLYQTKKKKTTTLRTGTNQYQQQIHNYNNKLPPILVCFGDSLTQGTVSSNFTTEIPKMLEQRNNQMQKKMQRNNQMQKKMQRNYDNVQSSWWLPKFINNYLTSFRIDDPIWVINTGANSLTSHVLVQEEWVQKTFHTILNIDSIDSSTTTSNSNNSSITIQNPNYVLIMIGTNDVLCMTSPFVRYILQQSHEPTGTEINSDVCTIPMFESNLRSIIRTVRRTNNYSNNNITTEIGICTIPPIGEEDRNQSRLLMSLYNQNVERINKCIEGIVKCDEFLNDKHITIIPVYNEFRKVIEHYQKNIKKKKQDEQKKNIRSRLPEPNFLFCEPMNMLYYATFGIVPRSSKWISGSNKLLIRDNIHLNERGRDIIARLVTDWIVQKQVNLSMKDK